MTALAVALVALVAFAAVLAIDRARDRRLAARLGAIAAQLEGRTGAATPAGPDVPAAAVAADVLGAAVARLQDEASRAAVEADAVAEARQRLELALDAVPQGVVVADEQARVVYRNAVASAFRDARHADALVAAALDELVAAAVAGDPSERTLELFGPPRRTLVITATPLTSPAGPAGALAVVEDLTERRRLDEVRRDFVANISHELKTPVGALSLLAETLLAEDDPEVVQRLAGRMLQEAERVASTIEDLLALSRIEIDDREHQPVDLRQVVDEAVDRIGPAAAHQQTRIEVRSDVDEAVVLGDRRQLVSAVANLLDNAVKYSEPGATVTVTTSAGDGHVELAVQDRGIGIPARDLERIFERFYRVDSARLRSTGGTGLGLAIVRHVAVNHDGDISVTSRLGEGSTFALRFPVADRGEAPTSTGRRQEAAPPVRS